MLDLVRFGHQLCQIASGQEHFIIMQDQLEIVNLKNHERIGKTYRVIVEDYDGYSDSYSGRTYMDAPEIDGQISFTTDKHYEVGEFADVVVMGVNDYDLIGRDVRS